MKQSSFADQLLFSTVRIETTDSDGRSYVGTGFIVNYEVSDGPPFLVTNRHVVNGMQLATLFFTERKGDSPVLGSRVDIGMVLPEEQWTGHPDPDVDISVIQIDSRFKYLGDNRGNIYYRAIPTSMFASEENLEDLNALEEIIFVGYPSGLFDSRNLLPITRRGITATHPNVDYEGRPVFLIDASVFRGSSGSPVFLYKPGLSLDGTKLSLTHASMFLGVLANTAMAKDKSYVETEVKRGDQIVRFDQMLDIGVVFKARKVEEAIEEVSRAISTPSGGPETDRLDGDK